MDVRKLVRNNSAKDLKLLRRITSKEVIAIMGWSMPTLNRKVKNGQFIQSRVKPRCSRRGYKRTGELKL